MENKKFPLELNTMPGFADCLEKAKNMGLGIRRICNG
jgi:hypothetical protein